MSKKVVIVAGAIVAFIAVLANISTIAQFVLGLFPAPIVLPTITPIPPTPERPAQVEIAFAAWQRGEPGDGTLSAYAKKYHDVDPSVTVDDDYPNNPVEESYQQTLKARLDPDTNSPDHMRVAAVRGEGVWPLITNQYLLELDKQKIVQSAITDNLKSGLAFFSDEGDKGKLYGIPRNLNPYSLIYNAPLWQQIGYETIPQDWGQFEQGLEKITPLSKVNRGLCIPSNIIGWLIFYYDERSKTPSGKSSYEPARLAAERLSDLHQRKLADTPEGVGMKSIPCVEAVNAGAFAAGIDSANNVNYFTTAIRDDPAWRELGTAEIPRLHGSTSFMHVDGYVGSVQGYPDDVSNFIIYLTSDQAFEELSKHMPTGISPRQTQANQQATHNSLLRPFVRAAEYAQGVDFARLSQTDRERLVKALADYLSRAITSDQFAEISSVLLR